MYGEATGKGAKFLEAPVSGSKVRPPPLTRHPFDDARMATFNLLTVSSTLLVEQGSGCT